MKVRVTPSDVAVAFEPLLQPSRYKGAYGGRGGAKSHFFGEQALLRCVERPTRIVCIREVQRSLRESVYQLLKDKIQYLGIGDKFETMDTEIRGRNGSLIIFRGMASYNAESIKSLEAYDVAWTEEAQTLSQKSLSLLRPTLRRDGSELWFSWNPRHRTDPVDMLFRKNPPPDAVSVAVNWRDNPWFPEVLRHEMLHDMATDPEMAAHVWEGGYGVSQGAILTRMVDAAERDGRINDAVEYDPEGPGIEMSDIGFRDTAAWWFWQRRVGGFALLDHVSDSGLDAEEWIEILRIRLAERDWKLAHIWLPHDARAKTFLSRYTTMEQFLSAFGTRVVRVVKRTSKTDRINAARIALAKCHFYRTRCAEGLDALRAWEYTYNEETQTYSREPLHSWASHSSDSFSYGCQVMTDYVTPVPEGTVSPFRGMTVGPQNEHSITFDEACELAKLEAERYGERMAMV